MGFHQGCPFQQTTGSENFVWELQEKLCGKRRGARDQERPRWEQATWASISAPGGHVFLIYPLWPQFLPYDVGTITPNSEGCDKY